LSLRQEIKLPSACVALSTNGTTPCYTSDRGDLAQELVQDAMLQAYLSLEKLNDPTRFKSWLYGIVLNICRNDLRRRKVICFSLEEMVGNLVDEPLPSHHPILRVAEEKNSTQPQSILYLPKSLSNFTVLPRAVQSVANRLNISVGSERSFTQISSSTERASPSRSNSTYFTPGD